MFEWNYSGIVLVNVNYIRRIGVSAPYLEQKDYRVVATLPYGNEIMYKGTEEDCKKYMQEFFARH